MLNFTILIETYMENLRIIMGHLKVTFPKFKPQWNPNLNMTNIFNIYSLKKLKHIENIWNSYKWDKLWEPIFLDLEKNHWRYDYYLYYQFYRHKNGHETICNK